MIMYMRSSQLQPNFSQHGISPTKTKVTETIRYTSTYRVVFREGAFTFDREQSPSLIYSHANHSQVKLIQFSSIIELHSIFSSYFTVVVWCGGVP